MTSVGRRHRRAVLHARHGGLCYWCGGATDMVTEADAINPERVATVDHVVPLARGGADGGDNLVLSCRACNRSKGDMDPETFAAMLADVAGGEIARAINAHVRGARSVSRLPTDRATLADVWPAGARP